MTSWGEPRSGTEAYAVKQEVLRKTQIAREKGLDKLLSDAYHEDGLRHYEAWFNSDRNKRWVHPNVTAVVNGRDEVNGKEIPFVEFSMAGQKYKITSKEWLGEGGMYDDLTLYMNGRRVFEVSESVDTDEYSTTYRPFAIEAYVNDEWVSAFTELKEHHRRVTEQVAIENAEDKERLQETKEAFGITTIPSTAETISKRPANSLSTVHKAGIWIVIAISVILAVLWATR